MLLDDKKYQCPVLRKMQEMLRGALTRARKSGRETDISIHDLLACYVEICPILDIDILWDNTDIVKLGSPSLDRIDNKKSYIKGNIQIISHRANSLKKDYLLCEWEKMRNYMTHCDNKPFEITRAHFKEVNNLTNTQQRDIRANMKRGYSIIEVSEDLEISVGHIINYLNCGDFS